MCFPALLVVPRPLVRHPGRPPRPGWRGRPAGESSASPLKWLTRSRGWEEEVTERTTVDQRERRQGAAGR
ncbi:hypothetical protein [Micromonospora sp. NPDC023644]|uniref:hypothetical protein n=1 Tax=Micromonospora sp. NPDC023644 TaxID=3154321 RepID=UPI0033D063A0